MAVFKSSKGSYLPSRTLHFVAALIVFQCLVKFSRGEGKSYRFQIAEGQPPHTHVGGISTQSSVFYYISPISSSPHHVLFSLNSTTGIITTSQTIDRENVTAKKEYIPLVILTRPISFSIEVRITVLDINDNPPRFPRPRIDVKLNEEKDGLRVSFDKAVDIDEGNNGSVKNYSIVSGNEEAKFVLVQSPRYPQTPVILYLQNVVKLNREEREFYQINISAADEGTPPQFGFLQVDITVTDINDNTPTFRLNEYSANINETAPSGTTVIQVEAQDSDKGSNSEITYSIDDSSPVARQFQISEKTGVVTTTQKLNCGQPEKTKTCIITLLATDNGAGEPLTSRAYLRVHIIDVNDHAPKITFRHFPDASKDYSAVNENAQNGTLVTIISVTDADEGINGMTNVSIISGNEQNHFELVPGDLNFVLVANNLDREKVLIYNLTLLARDMGVPSLSSSAFLVIYVNDVNDHFPEFEKALYLATLSELTPVGSFVAAVTAKDLDSGINSQLTYRIITGNGRNWFHINSKTGLVVTKSQLDYEIVSQVTLNISAQDGGYQPHINYTTLMVFIYDENDMSPIFSQAVYNISVIEGSRPGLILVVRAEDGDEGINGTFSFSLHPDVYQNYPDTFKLNSSSGALTIVKILDREAAASYTLKIIASDHGASPLSSTALVYLNVMDINDNSPVFYPTHYYPKLYENQPPNAKVIQVSATDEDIGINGKVEYFLLGGDVENFTVNRTTGWISTISSLDRETRSHYRLLISAKDGFARLAVNNATVEILVLDVTDEIPQFVGEPYNFSLQEDDQVATSVGEKIGHVQALSRDRMPNITYSIINGDPEFVFNIDSLRGDILRAKKIDRELKSEYFLRVLAISGTGYNETVIHITVLDLNDNAPMFAMASIEVNVVENWPVGTEIYQASAIDLDVSHNGKVTYLLRSNFSHPFLMEPGGMIYLNKPVNKAQGTEYRITVVAEDSGTPKLASSLVVVVHITDVNDHTPIFSRSRYSISLLESENVNYRFFHLSATDNDSGLNGQVVYDIVRGNEDKRFGIFPDGNLFIASELDRETKDFYDLIVIAHDKGVEPRSSSANITIQILDANDNKPVFTNHSYTLTIFENRAQRSYVGTVHATDADIGRNAELSYFITGEQENFAIDIHNGRITTLHSFDREKLANSGKDSFSFNVVVRDNGVQQLQSQVVLKVYISDVNDNAPLFTQKIYFASVLENANIGTSVIKLSASDPDLGENGSITYIIISGNSDQVFYLELSSGQVLLQKRLDREYQSKYLLLVAAYDGGIDVQLSSMATVSITVTDFNDNAPEFYDSPSKADLIETALPGKLIAQFHASDRDTGDNAAVRYAITQGNVNNTFHVDKNTGALYLMEHLDFEVKHEYHLNISAVDLGTPAKVSFMKFQVSVFDYNDNAPLFTRQPIKLYVKEGVNVNTDLEIVNAVDEDSGLNGKLTYKIVLQSPPGNHFNIDAQTGMIMVNRNIDYEKITNFNITVMAMDNARPISERKSAEKVVSIIVTDVNDNSPRFISPPTFVISSTASIGSKVGIVTAVDPDSGDNGRISYNLIGGDTTYFALEFDTGILTVASDIPSNKSTCTVTVNASDHGDRDLLGKKFSTAVFSIIIQSNSANGPIFSRISYSGHIYENVTIGSSILTVQARPVHPDGIVEYYVTKISSNNVSQPYYFTVNQSSGVLSTSDTLDRERGYSNFNVMIYAVERNRQSIGQLKTRNVEAYIELLDKNDSPPEFSSALYTVTVAENYSKGKSVTKVTVTDPDITGQVQVKIISGNDGTFIINHNSGIISTTRDLDRERTSCYDLKLQASDGIQTSSSIVQLTVTDVNDNAPVFSQMLYTFDLPEDMHANTSIFTVLATDEDEGINGKVSYSLLSHFGMNVFSLDSKTGTFTLQTALDFEQFQLYTLVVEAKDGGNPQLTATVTVYMNIKDVNDNSPAFNQSTYNTNILENVTEGTTVLTVFASDKDSDKNGQLRYDIYSGDEQGHFRIDADNGTIFTAKMLDREQQSFYSLSVMATDLAEPASRRRSSLVQVTVILQDDNDCAPEFLSANEIWIKENMDFGAEVYRVSAVDNDMGPNGYVEYFLTSQLVPFTIGPVDGSLKVKQQLDRESISQYTLHIMAKDKGFPARSSMMNLRVWIKDKNDNNPEFTQNQYQANISESFPVGQILLQISAIDADEGLNGIVRYFIINGDNNHDFRIDHSSGALRVQKALDYERKSSYQLIIQAEDSGLRTNSNTAAVYISIVDVNDNAPIFVDSPFIAYVQEGMTNFPVHVMQLSARDVDSPRYGHISYAVRDGDRQIFQLNSASGEITVLQELDRERKSKYHLKVIATDSGSPPLTGTGTVTIYVQDINDNNPVFLQPHFVGYVQENLIGSTSVATVKAVDDDEGANALIRYSLLNENDQFHIDPESGTLFTSSALDREQQEVYTLVVVGTDSGIVPKSATANITVYVGDVNDNVPQFERHNYSQMISDPTDRGNFVLGVTAVDLDIGNNGKVIYSLLGQDEAKFLINATTGVIITAQKLTSRIGQSFNIQVKATDKGQNPYTTQVQVEIILSQINSSNKPLFDIDVTQFTLNESIAVGHLITTMLVSPSRGLDIRYYIAGGNVNQGFLINERSGALCVANLLDYEETQGYEIWIKAQVFGNSALSSFIQLIIWIHDVNDNAPHFTKMLYNTSIYETNIIGTMVTNVTAYDADSGSSGRVQYHITGGNLNEAFQIDSGSGYIRTKSIIDRETVDYYRLFIEAIDQGATIQHTGTTTVEVFILDVDDNSPRFTRQFSASIPENAELGSFVLCLSTKDLDIGENAAVSYILKSNPGNKFILDATSGNITVSAALDAEHQDSYHLHVAAKASSHNTETDVEIEILDVNDNAPKFSLKSFFFNIPELQSPPFFVGKVIAKDQDKTEPNNQFYFSLKIPSLLFRIGDKTGKIYTITELQYNNVTNGIDAGNSYELTVQAMDLGVPSRSSETVVVINVIDANEHQPVFEKDDYYSAVPYDIDVGRTILHVLARDGDTGINAEIGYLRTDGSGSDFFDINVTTGHIFVTSSLSNQQNKTFVIMITAKDKGQPSLSATVLVHLSVTGPNQHAPYFLETSCQENIKEDVTVGHTVKILQATDDDSGPNGQIHYYISAGNDRGHFSIHAIRGNLLVARSIDFETIPTYQLNITVRDNALFFQQATITCSINLVDVNDNPPVFNQSTFHAYIPENSPSMTSIFRAVATDADSPANSIIEYLLNGDTEAQAKFSLNKLSGVLKTHGGLDFESQEVYSLFVVAQNPQTSLKNTATIIVHLTGVNEFYPHFSQKEYNFSISESVRKGTEVGSVKATDLDSGRDGIVYYYLIGSSNLKGFHIDFLSGIITVSGRPDYESHPRITLEVLAKNWPSIKGNDTDTCFLHISITDANDPPIFSKPVYRSSVSENVISKTSLIQVKALDNDLRPDDHHFSYTILAGNTNNSFLIDTLSGWIFTNGVLDRETVPVHNVTVGAVDRGSPPQTGSAIVMINLEDVNDCPPMFIPSPLITNVSENRSIGTTVTILSEHTTDRDLPGNQGPFTYFSVPGNHNQYFAINRTSGKVTTKEVLDREVHSVFYIPVKVTDAGQPQMTSTLSFKVEVLDINDTPPSPRSLVVLVVKYQDKFPEDTIADVQPLDPDLIGNYFCQILKSTSSSFSILSNCNLHVTSLPTLNTNILLVNGSDGVSSVSYNVTVNIMNIDNNTLQNSLILKIASVSVENFLQNKQGTFIEYLITQFESRSIASVFAVRPIQKDLLLFLMVTNGGLSVPRSLVKQKIDNIRNYIKNQIGMIITDSDYSPCVGSPCKNSGTCSDQLNVVSGWSTVNTDSYVITAPSLRDYTCNCVSGYMGTNCETRESACGNYYCQNGGLCISKLGSDPYCECPPNWSGTSCENYVNACLTNPCKNGGKCNNTNGSFHCVCKDGFSGPLCQTLLDFCSFNPCKNGASCLNKHTGFTCSCTYENWGKFCEKSSISFSELSFMEFGSINEYRNNITIFLSTKQENALLLYNPSRDIGAANSQNFLALEILGGNIQFSIAAGSNTALRLRVTLNVVDGKWYKISVLRIKKNASLSVSRCSAGVQCTECVIGDPSCSSSGLLTKDNLQLNSEHLFLAGIKSINKILQHPGQVHSHDFVGCIKSFWINGLDMTRLMPHNSSGMAEKCLRSNFDGPCAARPCRNGGRCVDEWSAFRCVCPDKYMGKLCEKEWKSFSFGGAALVEFKRRESYHRTQLLQQGTAKKKRSTVDGSKVSIRFRTLQSAGLLWMAASSQHYIMLMVKKKQLHFLCSKKGNEDQVLILPVNVSNGIWHEAVMETAGDLVQLKLDGKNETKKSFSQLLDVSSTDIEVILLANTKSGNISGQILQGFSGCLTDFFVNNQKMPFNGATDRFEIQSEGKVGESCDSICEANPCKGDTVCHELSEGYKCLPVQESSGGSLPVGIIVAIMTILVLAFIVIIVVILFRKHRGLCHKLKGVSENSTKETRGAAGRKTSGTPVNPSYHDSNFGETGDLPDEIIIRNHIIEELAQKNIENGKMPRPDIIESENRPSIPLEMEDGTVIIENGDLAQVGCLNENIAEHYDLENASSIAPSDIDVVTHYKGYRDGKVNRYKTGTKMPAEPQFYPSHVSSKLRDSPYLMAQGRNSPWLRQIAVTNLTHGGPLSVPARSSPMHLNNLARNTPSPSGMIPMNQLSRQSPSMPGQTPSHWHQTITQSALMSGRGGKMGKSTKTSNRLLPNSQIGVMNNQIKGLTVDEVNMLNARSNLDNPESLAEAVSSSDENVRYNRSNNLDSSGILDAPDSSSNSSGNDSFTCSEFEYENERLRTDFEPGAMIYSKLPEVENENENDSPVDNNQTFDGLDSAGESFSTIASSDEDKNRSHRTVGSFDLDHLLTWGPNFEKLVGVFVDIASLPNNENNHQQVTGEKSDKEEYV